LSIITISSFAPGGSGRYSRASGTETKDSLPIWSAGQGLSDSFPEMNLRVDD